MMSQKRPCFNKVIIFGAGLIGGSFALALKAVGQVGEVVGFGRRQSSLLEAMKLGVIDRIGEDSLAEVKTADLVLLATPVGQMPDILKLIAPALHDGVVVTDGGSTKTDVVAAVRMHLGTASAWFVPAHPIAGAENSGASAAKADLYQGKKVVLTPLAENSSTAVDRVRQAWSLCGASMYELTPEKHDQVFAAVSHLPHLLSYALVHDLAIRDDSDVFFEFAASGFRDFTRIAASHPEMWRDICLANREALLKELQSYQRQLFDLENALKNSDAEMLERVFETARTARREWSNV